MLKLLTMEIGALKLLWHYLIGLIDQIITLHILSLLFRERVVYAGFHSSILWRKVIYFQFTRALGVVLALLPAIILRLIKM